VPASSRPTAADAKLLRALERAFAQHAGADAKIDLQELKKALGLKSEYLARRVMKTFDTNGDGFIHKQEFLAGVRTLVFGSDREKLHFAFRLHDDDGDGALDRQEVLRMIAISMAESAIMERATQPAEQLTRALFHMADRDRNGKITFDELEAVVARRPELLRRMTRSEAIWISPNEDVLMLVEGRAAAGRLRRLLENGWAPWVFLAVWAAANVAIFVWAAMRGQGRSPNPLMQIGRALGVCIDFDGALILVPMMRRVLTWVRCTWLGRVVPIDDAIDFHRIVGHTLFALAVTHALTFAGAFMVGHASSPLWRMLLQTERGLTGVVLLAVFTTMWVCSLVLIRKTSRFELFYFTHLLYVAWFVLAILHAPQFLFWAGVPLVGFAVEQALRLRRRAPQSTVVSAEALRSGVTRVELRRPPGFAFGPGDYVFLRFPAIARHEWHPFTISSAPERDTLTFHVRSLGNWTSALRRTVEDEGERNDMVAYVDGPYGSPSAHIFESRHAVLIGAGIGVTPFASVLESLVLRANAKSSRPSKLEKAHFFWLNRDQYSFEWFALLLSDLEKIDLRGMLEIHLCMTGGRAGATAMGLEVAREIMHASGRSDIITGLRTHTHMGPPDWDTMLGLIKNQHAPHRVDVYFCGPPGLASKLRSLCDRLGMTFREERF
jgi:predicted ferric reductase/Ca2+-binding EF-hand superfamily protein